MKIRIDFVSLLVIVFIIGIAFIGNNISGRQLQIAALVECSDGLDNDLDGKIDFGNDPGCESSFDNDEYNCRNPRNIVIRDGDGYIDEDQNDPDWIWVLRNLDEVGTTNIYDPDNIVGPTIGLRNDFVKDDFQDDPPGIGEGYKLPVGFDGLPYAEINFESLLHNRFYTPVDVGATDRSYTLGEAIEITHPTQQLHFKLRTNEWDEVEPDLPQFTNGIVLKSEIVDNGLWARIYVKDYNIPYPHWRYAGRFILSGRDTEVLNIDYYDTSDDNVVISANLQVGCGTENIIIKAKSIGDNLNELDHGEDEIWASFSKNDRTGLVEALGCIPRVAEDTELIWVTSGYSINLGTKNEDHRTRYGIEIRNPELNGGRYDRALFFVTSDQVQGDVDIESCFDQRICQGVREDIPLGKALVDSGYGFDWQYDYNSFGNNFQNTKIRYNNKNIKIHDVLVLGLDSPSIETSLTSHDDDYQTDVFMETLSGKMSYYYSFDSPVDLTKITNNNRLRFNFLGRHFEAIEYIDDHTLKVEICKEGFDIIEGDEIIHGCLSDAQCEDGLYCTTDRCVNGQCVQEPTCHDGRACTDDICDENARTCEYRDNGRVCCTTNDDCVDPNNWFCSIPRCEIPQGENEGFCNNQPRDCRDGVRCTSDWCDTQRQECRNEPRPNCSCYDDQGNLDCPPGEVCCGRYCSVHGTCGG